MLTANGTGKRNILLVVRGASFAGHMLGVGESPAAAPTTTPTVNKSTLVDDEADERRYHERATARAYREHGEKIY